MKKSIELRELANTTEDDLRALGIQTKALREQKWENFKEIWWPKLLASPRVLLLEPHEDSFKITLDIDSLGNKWDFFPKANKLLIRKGNKWKKPGLKFLIDNVINRV